MKKLLNYIMATVFIYSVCALDSKMWYIPAITCLVSGIYLFATYKSYEVKCFNQGGEDVES